MKLKDNTEVLEKFCEVASQCRTYAQIAKRLGVCVNQARYLMHCAKASGMDAPNLTRNNLSNENFAKIWNESESLTEVALKTGLRKESLTARAAKLRTCGYQMQLFFSGGAIKPPTKSHGKLTKYAPGSVERVRVYRERAERGEPIFNPDDTTCDGARKSTMLGFTRMRFKA